VEVTCPKCGTENWLENQGRCFACNTVLRRCIDCSGYNANREECRVVGTDVGRYEAENPSLLSMSANCLNYRPAAAAKPWTGR
jgi:hypothetical protein